MTFFQSFQVTFYYNHTDGTHRSEGHHFMYIRAVESHHLYYLFTSFERFFTDNLDVITRLCPNAVPGSTIECIVSEQTDKCQGAAHALPQEITNRLLVGHPEAFTQAIAAGRAASARRLTDKELQQTYKAFQVTAQAPAAVAAPAAAVTAPVATAAAAVTAVTMVNTSDQATTPLPSVAAPVVTASDQVTV